MSSQCKFCDLALTYHRERDVDAVPLLRLRGAARAALSRSAAWARSAIRGSARKSCKARSRRSFPTTSSAAWTATRCAGPAATNASWTRSASGLIHILLGTQMIAKGLDFPNVTLVGVVNADVGLHLPDFRSAERTFQLLAQVAGPSGPWAARRPGAGADVHAGAPVHRPGGARTITRLRAARSWRTAGSTTIRRIQRLARLIVRSKDQEEGGRLRRAAGRRLPGGARNTAAGRRPAGRGAAARPGRGAGLSAQGLLSLPLPAAVAERRLAAPAAPRRAADAARCPRESSSRWMSIR